MDRTRFHMTHVTKDYHRVRPKRYLSLWYVWRKPCTYLALTLTPSPNGPNEIPHDPRHLADRSVASKTISEPVVHLAQTVHLSYINTNTISKQTERDSTWPTSPRSSIGCVQNDFRAYGMFDAPQRGLGSNKFRFGQLVFIYPLPTSCSFLWASFPLYSAT